MRKLMILIYYHIHIRIRDLVDVKGFVEGKCVEEKNVVIQWSGWGGWVVLVIPLQMDMVLDE